MSTVTLQNLCLTVIVSKFKRYCELYYSTEDSCLKLKFEFLKKKFSLFILQKLKEEHRLKSKYLDFLINKYLKVLDTRWLRAWPWEAICQRLAEIGTNLEKVTFLCDRPWEEVLCCLPNLKIVCFIYFCTDKFLLSLSKCCKYVKTLDVTYSYGVSVDGLMHLCCKDDDKNMHSRNAPIKELFVRYTSIGNEDIAVALKNMPCLEKIDYYNLYEVLYSMHKSDINAFEKVKPYNLTHLYVPYAHETIFNDIFTVCASVCPRLKSLHCSIYHKHALDLCTQLQELEELELDCHAEDRLELNELLTLNGKKLTSLDIFKFCMSLSILAQNCPELISLKMSDVILQYNCNDSVPVFHNLEKVVMDNLVITEAVTCLLSSAPNLKQLCFHECDLRSSDVKVHILRCCEQCELNVIDFLDSDVELELVKDVLLTCSTLQTLKFNHDITLQLGTLANLNDDVIGQLRTLAETLPNKPQILWNEYDNIQFEFYSNSNRKISEIADYDIIISD